MPSRFETVPEDFLIHLRNTILGFSLESERHQFALARMAWIGLNKYNQHSRFKGCMTFTHKELEGAFGRAKFELVNRRLGMFQSTSNWYKDLHLTKGYSFAGDLRGSVAEYLTASPWPTTTRLMMTECKAVKKVPPAVASKDKSGVTTRAWGAAKKLNLVKVDLNSLAELKTVLQEWVRFICEYEGELDVASLLAKLKRAVEAIGKVCRLAMTKAAGMGYMAHHYEESNSGRLYPTGISLASVQTLVKDAALTGCWEYDISNCHYAILAQMSAQFGHVCPTVEDYLKRKEQIRDDIADQAGISRKEVKTCLVALIYGARASTWHKNAIPEEIGKDAAERLYATPLFMGLSGDLAKARAVILSNCLKTRTGSVINAFGKSISSKSKPEQKMAHLLQGVEAKVLQAVVNSFSDDIVLVQHDGFVSATRLDVNMLSDAIFEATRYRLELVEKQLKADPDRYFADRK